MSFMWALFKLHDSFICTSYAAHNKYSCSLYEIADNDFIWASYTFWSHCQLFHTKFNCVAYEVHMKVRMKIIWSSYEVHMTFIWSLHEAHTCLPVQISCQVYMKFIWSSYKVYMKFRWIAYVININCIWNTCEMHMKVSCNNSYSTHT